MDANYTDIFISYRRVDGRDCARNIYLALKSKGYKNVFFDYNSMREGMFNEQILTAISNCKDFILILSPRSMERCVIEGDWVAREIDAAIDAGCKIIPIQINEPFANWPDGFPRRFNFIKQIEFLTLRTDEYFDASIERLINWLNSKPLEQKSRSGPGDFMLTIETDETCEFKIDGLKIRKVKSGKPAKLIGLIKPGRLYHMSFVSLQSKTTPIDMEYSANELLMTDIIKVSFAQMREDLKTKNLLEKQKKEQEKLLAREKEGLLMQACEQYDWTGCQGDGMTAVCIGGKIGYLNDNAFEVISCMYDNVSAFCNGYATVCKDQKWGVINKDGQTIIPFESDRACWQNGNYRYFIFTKDGKHGISTIDQGIPEELPYYNVLCVAGQPEVFIVNAGTSWRIIDMSGNNVIENEISYIIGESSPSMKLWKSEDWALEVLHTPFGAQDRKSRKVGYFNSQFKLSIPFANDDFGMNTTSKDYVIISANNKKGVANAESGKFIIPPIYEELSQIHSRFLDNYERLFFKVADKGAQSYILYQGKEVIICDEEANILGGNQGVIDDRGTMIVPQIYSFIHGQRDFFIAFHLENLIVRYRTWESTEEFGTSYNELHYIYDDDGSYLDFYDKNGAMIERITLTDYDPYHNHLWLGIWDEGLGFINDFMTRKFLGKRAPIFDKEEFINNTTEPKKHLSYEFRKIRKSYTINISGDLVDIRVADSSEPTGNYIINKE